MFAKVIEFCLKLIINDTITYYYVHSFPVFLLFILVIAISSVAFFKMRKQLLIKEKKYYDRVKWDSKTKFEIKHIFDYTFLWIFRFVTNVLIIPLILIFAVSGLFRTYGERLFLKLNTDKLGIVVSRFYGANVDKHFGQNGFQDRIINDLNSSLPPELREKLEIHESNRTAEDGETARLLRKQLRAKYLIWGYLEEGADSLSVTIHVDGPFELSMLLTDAPGDTMRVFLKANLHVSLPLAQLGPSQRLESFLRECTSWTAILISQQSGNMKDLVKYCDLLDHSVKADTLTFPTRGRSFVYVTNLLGACGHDSLKEWTQSVKCWQIVDSVASIDPSIPRSFRSFYSMMLARALENVSRKDLAIENLKLAVSRDPVNRGAYEEISRMFAQEVHYDSVLQYASIGLKTFPNSSILKRWLGTSYFMLHDTTTGLRYLGEALTLDPTDSTALAMLCLIRCALVHPGSLESSVDSCSSCIDLYSNRFRHSLLHLKQVQLVAFLNTMKLEQASELIRSNVHEIPSLAIYYADLAFKYARIDDYENADHCRDKFIALTEDQIVHYAAQLKIDKNSYMERYELLKRNQR